MLNFSPSVKSFSAAFLLVSAIGGTSWFLLSSQNGRQTSTKQDLKQNNLNAFLQDKRDSSVVDFIFKTVNEGEKSESCSTWNNGEVTYKTKEECKEFTLKTLGKDSRKHPNVWIRTDKENIDWVLRSYFPKSTEEGKVAFNKVWVDEEKSLSCIKEIPFNSEKIEISCYFNPDSYKKSQEVNKLDK